MDFLRYLTTRVSKTDKSISLTTEVFKNQPIIPEPPLPIFISELIPTIDEKPKIWNAEALTQCYKLYYEIRAKLINQLATFFGTSSPSLSQNEYMAIITLQSCCTLFFTPIDSIIPDDLYSFMLCLKISIKFLPQNLTIFPDFFAIIFERLLSVDDTVNIYLILKPIQVFANEYPEYTANCLNTHAIVFSRLASSVISQGPSIDIDLVSNQLNIITKAFDANKNLDKEICMSMRTVLLLLMGHLKNQKTISKIVFPIISLFIILKKETNCDIFQLDELLVFLIKDVHRFFEFTNSNTKFSPDLKPEPISFKFIEEKTFDKNVPADLENIKSFETLMKFNGIKYPLFHASILLGQSLVNCQFDFTQQILTDLFSDFNNFYLYPYFSFLFLFIQHFTKYQEEICQCLTTLNLWDYIFGPIMFDPKVPNNSKIINLRQSLFESLGILASNENACKIIRKYYCNFLKSILNFPFLFAQVLQMSYPAFRSVYTLSIQDDLFNSIIFELINQQRFHIEGDKEAPKYRIPTMTVLNAILQNNDALGSVVSSRYFCSGILHFLFEEPCLLFFVDIIDRVIQYFATNNKSGKIDSTALNDSFHMTFQYIIDNIKDERAMNIIHCVLNLFTRVVSFEPSFITPLLVISSSILSDLMTILVNLPANFKSIRVMEIGLMLLSALHSCSNFNYEAVPFAAIGESIERLGVTKDFLLLIYQIIFSGWSKSTLATSTTTSSSLSIYLTDKSTTIAVPEAIPLLLISVRNTEHYLDVLNRLIELCKDSVCNCCSCLMVNVPTIVFENTKLSSEKDVTLALRLFYEISKYVSNRQSLFSFFRLFSSFDRTKLNPLTLPCINTLEQIIYNADVPSYCSIIQFSSENSIIRLPPLSIRDLQSGFIISAKLLLDSEKLSRYFFEFKNDTQNLSAFFTYGTLNFIVNDTQITPTFEMPMRKWFTLRIFFKSFENCEIYFDDDLIETINFHTNTLFQDFKKCAMFHKNSTDPEALPLQVQYVTISTKSNAWNLTNLNIPGMSYFQSNEMKTLMNNSTNIFEFYADKVVPFDSGKNILTKIPSAHYTGLTIRFFTNFLKVFQACHSISFMITLTAMVAFQDPNSYPISGELLRKLSSLFTLLISKLPENTANMLTRDSYSIISFFTSESSPLYFTKDIYEDFMTQLTIIPSQEQREMLSQWIIFNYKIIGRASIDTKIYIFNSWKTILEKWPNLADTYLTFQLLLYIFRTLVESKDNIQTILDIENQATGHTNKIEDLEPKLTQARQIICSLLTIVFGKDFKDTDTDLLFYSVISCSVDQPIIELLDCVKLFLIKYDLSNKFYGAEHVNISIPWNYLTTVVSIKNTWASIYINLSEKVCCKFQSIYADTNYINHEDTNKYCQYLIARRTCNSNYVEDSSDFSLVTNSCRLMLGIEESTSLESMIEMNSLFLQVPVFFVYAVVSCIPSSEKMNDLFVMFFDKLCSNNTNVSMLADKLSTYSLFYLMYWAVKRRPAALFSIATILSQKAQLAQDAINIIDSFSINCNYDLSKVRSDLLCNIMTVISTRKPDQDIIQMGEVLALAILFRSHSTTNHQLEKAFKESPFYTGEEEEEIKDDKKEDFPELEYLSSLYIVEPDPDNPVMQTYSLYYDSDGKWVEVELAKKVIMLLSLLWKSFDIDVHQSLCILISIIIQEVNNYEDLNGLQPIIEDLINEFKITDEFVNLVVGKIAHRGNVEAVKKLFWPILTKVIEDNVTYNNNDFESNNVHIASINSNNINTNFDIKSNLLSTLDRNKLKKRRNTYDNVNIQPSQILNLDLESNLVQNLFINGYLAMNNYCDQPPASLPILTRELVASFVPMIEQFPKTPKPLSQEVNHHINESIAKIKESINEKHHIAGRHWRQLWQLMTYERSPFFLKQQNMNSKIHLKRSSNFHKKLLIPILKRNTSFNKHAEASMKRDSNPAESLTHLPRGNSFAISSLPSHFNFFKDNSNDSLPEIVTVPNRYIWKARCDLIKITKTVEGSFLVSSSGFSFLDNESHLRIVIPAENVYLIFRQYYLQRPTAIEIFTTNNKSYFFNFPDVGSHKFLSYFKSILMPNAKFIQSYSPQVELARLDLTRKWSTRQISTFEYLMWINELSGRSMNNLNAYPIFPWILNDYSSEKIDLNDESVYRDLSKPVGALNPTRLAKLKALIDAVPDINFLYQSTYSSSFMVLHLLIRLEPYTTVHIKYQDGKFDVASRVFTSIADCYQRCCNNNSNFRELIPEFFFCPEFLRNDDKFDLGVLPDGSKIEDVVLPPWAKTANEFIHIHKTALESDYVSTHINKWIDLIWGCKQTGEEAIRSDNTFDPRLYPDCWEKINDPNDVAIVEDMLMKVGIIPQKIFEAPHPARQQKPKLKKVANQKLRAGSLSLLTAYSRADKLAFNPNYTPDEDNTTDTSNNDTTHYIFEPNLKIDSTINTLSSSGNFLISSRSAFAEIKVANNTIIDTKINGESIEKFKIFSLHTDGRIFISRTNSSVTPVAKDRIGKIAIYTHSKSDSALFAFATENSSDLIIVKSNGSIAQKMSSSHIDAISCASFYREEVITGGKDSIVVKWSFNDKQELEDTQSLMAHAATVSCIYASDNFGIVVSCSIDGLLVASLISDFSFMMAIEMKIESNYPGYIPIKVMITDMTGRIFVLCSNSNSRSSSNILCVYTINGKFLNQISLDKCVSAWCQAPRADGFDFIVFADSSNAIYLLNAFNLNIDMKIFQAPAKVTHLHYHNSIDLLAIGTESGSLYVGSLFY